MKKILLIFTLLLLSGFNFYLAQGRMHKQHFRMREKFKQLEKIKLLEELNLDEETAIRFFSRRNKFIKAQNKIIKERKELIKQAELLLENKNKNQNDYNGIIKKMNNVEEKLLLKRKEFLKTVEDILTKEQIVKMIVFDYKFKEKIRNFLMKKGRRKME